VLTNERLSHVFHERWIFRVLKWKQNRPAQEQKESLDCNEKGKSLNNPNNKTYRGTSCIKENQYLAFALS
jgi:hypothetical protein